MMARAEQQLTLSDDWGLKECRSEFHVGNRMLPVEAFVKNGTYRRTCCRACWAKYQRQAMSPAERGERVDTDLVAMLHKLWRPKRPA